MEETDFLEQLQKLNLQVSNHAMDRYKERVRNDDTNVLDEETKKKYTEELKKLYLSSELVYSGIIGHSTNEVDVYLNKNGWVLLLAKNQKQVITLYKVDLNVGDDDLNQVYIDKSLAQIKSIIEDGKRISDEVDTNKVLYLDEIEKNKVLIKELKAQLDMLAARNESLADLVKTEDVKNYQSKVKLRNVLENYMVKDKLKVE